MLNLMVHKVTTGLYKKKRTCLFHVGYFLLYKQKLKGMTTV